jgi:3D (Asp-Asp-Asp) domain-containing protein/peptidoglycan hydrolase CwlO-like protein
VRTGCKRSRARLGATGFLLVALLFAAVAAGSGDAEAQSAPSGELAVQTQDTLLALYALETRLAGAERRLADLHSRQDALEARETAARKELEIAGNDLDEAERRLAARLRALYMEGEVDPLAVLLGAESLDDALSALDGLGRVASQDVSIVGQVRQARRHVRDSLATLRQRQADLGALVARAESQRAALVAARAERAAYLAELRSRADLSTHEVGRLTAKASAAEKKSETIEHGGGGSPAPAPPPPPASGTKMTVFSTGYCLRGTTATGIPTGWGVVAVDPAVIPLGTRMIIPGYGEGVAADTGGAVRGATIDVWFPECSQALAWGQKYVTITLL